MHSLTVSKAAGQRRHDLRIGRQPGYVDAARSGQNRVLIEPPSPASMRERTVERRARSGPQRALRSNAGIATAGIVTFGHAAQAEILAAPVERRDAAYRAVAGAIAEHYGVGLLGLVVHADEAAPHAHFWLERQDRDRREPAGGHEGR